MVSRDPWTKVQEIREISVNGQTPNHAKFNGARSNDAREKRYIFYILRYFGAQGGPPPPMPKFTNLGDDV